MGLVYLTTGEMVEATSHWLGSERATFESIAELKALLPMVEAAHQGLLAFAPSAAAPTYPIYDSAEVLDNRQDHLMRCVNYLHLAYREYLLGQVNLDANAVQRVKESKKALLPHGMAGSKVGYVEEAGNAQLAKEALAKTPSAAHVIGELRLTATVTGQDVLDQWFAAAAALGVAVQQKSQTETDPGLGFKVLQARQAWISIVRTVMAVLEHAQAPASKVAAIRNLVEDIEERATKRAMAAQAKTAKTPAAPAGPTRPTT